MEDRQVPSPLHKEMSRYAMRFAKAVFLGELPLSRGGPIASATMTLLRFDQLYLGVTCHHVLAHYSHLKQAGANLIFQVGPVQFDPLLQLIDEDPKRDLVTFDLTVFRDDIRKSENSNFVEPRSWPPAEVSDVDVICLAGYPGIWRDQLSSHELRFHSFSLGASQVQAAGEEHFVIQVHSKDDIVTIDKGMNWGSLGGMSGGPVFCWRQSGSLLLAELVGFITEYQERLDLMYLRAAKVINRDGTFA